MSEGAEIDLSNPDLVHAMRRGMLACILSFSNKWDKDRYFKFLTYIASFRSYDVPFPPTKSELKTLKKIFVRNEEEPIIYRCQAAITIAMQHEAVGDRQLSIEYVQEALAFIEQAAEEDRQRCLCTYQITESGEVERVERTVGELLEELRESAVKVIQDAEEDPVARFKEALANQDVDLTGWGAVNDEFVARWKTIGGSRCDRCKKTSSELGKVWLDHCSRCKRAFYCSRECQVQAWKDGHKEACRKKGEIKPGDIMTIRDEVWNMTNEIEYGMPVVVLSEVPDRKDFWRCALLGKDLQPVEVPNGIQMPPLPTKMLAHIRPAK